MADKLSILIVEDDPIIALGLEMAVEDRGGIVVGPADTVAHALELIALGGIHAAVIDANLIDRDVAPVALLLLEQALPFVVHTGTGLPVVLAEQHPDLPVMMKPTDPGQVIARLLRDVAAPPSRS